MPRLRRVALSIALLMPTLAAAAPWQGRTEMLDGVQQVQNPAAPADAEQELVLDELWRAGDDEEAEDFFGVISDAVVDAAGDVYLLDSQLVEVKRYSADGEFLGTIGREGEGPGEFRFPTALFLMDDGRLGVLQGRPARVVLFHTDGTPAGDLVLPTPEDGGFRFVQRADARGNTLALQGMEFRRGDTGGERTQRLVLMPADGQGETKELLSHSTQFDFAKPERSELDEYLQWVLLPGGRVAAAETFDYRLRLWGADGALERVVTVDYPDLARSGDELAAVKERLQGGMRFRGRRNLDVQVQVEPREPGVRWMDVDAAGRLWVLSGRGAKAQDATHLGAFDVFDASGRLLHRLRLAGDGDIDADRFVLAGDRLLVLKEFDSAMRAMRGGDGEDAEEDLEDAVPMSVICYRLPALDS